MTNLLDILAERAAGQDDRVAFLNAERGDAVPMTYGQLWSSAGRVAAAIRARASTGDRVLLVFPSGLHFITAFVGTLASGCIAVPASPPDPRRPERSTARLGAILEDAEPRLILADPSLVDLVRAQTSTPSLTIADADEHDAVHARSADCAYLQYTSGSTLTPRGVMVTHDNLMANCRFAHRYCGFSSASRLVSWVPHYHDQGLVYGICQPIYDGFPCVLLSPQTFIERPRSWLEQIARHRATHAGGPNFTYDVAVRKVPESQRTDLDLSSWICAYVAAEPVRASTLDAFADAYASCGFRRAAFQPSYGLAEATLRVAAAPLGEPLSVIRIAAEAFARGHVRRVARDDPTAIELVGHGPVVREHREMLIVDPESRAVLGEDRVGEIWIAGPDIAAGYWNRPADSMATFGAETGDGRAPFLRSGDLGFVSDGRLYIAGRLKDVIIIRGLNHYPQDLERTVEQTLPLVRPGGVAVFGVEHRGEEHVVVAAEIRQAASERHGDTADSPIADRGWSADRICGVLQRRLAERHDVTLLDLVLLMPSTLPKTSSGKVRRGECKRQYLEGRLTLARDRHGFVPGLSYRLRDDLAAAAARHRDAPSAIEALDPPARPHEWDRPIAEFFEPRHPGDVAALLSRTPEQFRDHLDRLRQYIERGWIEPSVRERSVRDRTMRLGITGWRRPQSPQLFFVYTGINARLMMPPIDFLTHTGLVDHNVVMFRDRLRDNYLSGVSIEIPTLESLLAYQRGLLDAAPQVTSTYSLGTSMGAVAAILAGHFLDLDAVWAFAPQVLRPTSTARPGDGFDVRALLERSNGITHYHIYFHAEQEPDATFAREVEGLPGVVLHPQPGTGHHVVQWLWKQGLLGSMFPGSRPPRAADTVAAPDPPTTDPGACVWRVVEIVRKTVRTATRIEWAPLSPLAQHLDSFATIELLAELESGLGVKLQLSELRAPDLQTPASLTAFVQRHMSRARAPGP